MSVSFPSSVFQEVNRCFLVVLMFICSEVFSALLWVLKITHLQRQLCKVAFRCHILVDLLHGFRMFPIMVPAQGCLSSMVIASLTQSSPSCFLLSFVVIQTLLCK